MLSWLKTNIQQHKQVCAASAVGLLVVLGVLIGFPRQQDPLVELFQKASGVAQSEATLLSGDADKVSRNLSYTAEIKPYTFEVAPEIASCASEAADKLELSRTFGNDYAEKRVIVTVPQNLKEIIQNLSTNELNLVRPLLNGARSHSLGLEVIESNRSYAFLTAANQEALWSCFFKAMPLFESVDFDWVNAEPTFEGIQAWANLASINADGTATVDLSWSKPSSYVKEYWINYHLNDNQDWQNVQSTTESATITNLQKGQTYTFSVYGYYGAGGSQHSFFSNNIKVITTRDTNLADISNLKIAAGANDTNVTLRWNKVANADVYDIFYGTESGQYSYTREVGVYSGEGVYTNEARVIIDGLSPTQEYFFTVKAKAYDDTGREFKSVNFSNEVSGVPGKLITDVPAPAITVVSPNGGEVLTADTAYEVQWTNTTGRDVRVELIGGGVERGGSGLIPAGMTSYQIYIPSQPGTDYKIRITDATNGQYFDESDAPFMIAGETPTPSVPSVFINLSSNNENSYAAAGANGVKIASYTFNPQFSDLQINALNFKVNGDAKNIAFLHLFDEENTELSRAVVTNGEVTFGLKFDLQEDKPETFYIKADINSAENPDGVFNIQLIGVTETMKNDGTVLNLDTSDRTDLTSASVKVVISGMLTAESAELTTSNPPVRSTSTPVMRFKLRADNGDVKVAGLSFREIGTATAKNYRLLDLDSLTTLASNVPATDKAIEVRFPMIIASGSTKHFELQADTYESNGVLQIGLGKNNNINDINGPALDFSQTGGGGGGQTTDGGSTLGANGESCTSDSDCESNYCDGDICQ